MDNTQNRFSKITALMIILTGALFFTGYLIYLPNPSLFATEYTQNAGLILYSLATAGCGFIAWGVMLLKLDQAGITREQLLRATGTGFLLLAAMRLGTAVFPHAPFDEIRMVPVMELVIFSVIGLKFYKL